MDHAQDLNEDIHAKTEQHKEDAKQLKEAKDLLRTARNDASPDGGLLGPRTQRLAQQVKHLAEGSGTRAFCGFSEAQLRPLCALTSTFCGNTLRALLQCRRPTV